MGELAAYKHLVLVQLLVSARYLFCSESHKVWWFTEPYVHVYPETV